MSDRSNSNLAPDCDKAKAAAHTPAPWRVYERQYPHHRGRHHVERMIVTAWDDPQLKGPIPVVRLSSGIPATEGDPWISFCSIDAADANLIAAAPDLLEALKGLHGAYMALREQVPADLRPPTNNPASWASLARSAIQRAEGGQ